MGRKVVALSSIWLTLIAVSFNVPATDEYENWDVCSKSEPKGLEDLVKLKKDGHDLVLLRIGMLINFPFILSVGVAKFNRPRNLCVSYSKRVA